jgi:hypothetical protein
MKFSKLLLASLAASTMAWLPLPAAAQVGIYLDVAPPAPRYEVVPAPRRGYVWQPGFWDWRDGRHHWRKGHWVRERSGMYWHPNRWEQRDGRWYFERGRWDRQRWAQNRHGPRGDRDRDGVPDRYDRDKDGDGVPNRRDDRPNNPNRY